MRAAQPTCVLTYNTSFSARVKGLKACFQRAGKKGVQELASWVVGWYRELGPSAQTCQSFHDLIIYLCKSLQRAGFHSQEPGAPPPDPVANASPLPATMMGVKKVKEVGDLREPHGLVLSFTGTFPTSFRTGDQSHCRNFRLLA